MAAGTPPIGPVDLWRLTTRSITARSSAIEGPGRVTGAGLSGVSSATGGDLPRRPKLVLDELEGVERPQQVPAIVDVLGLAKQREEPVAGIVDRLGDGL